MKAENFLDHVFARNPAHAWETDENGAVTLAVEHRGLAHWVAHRFFHRPQISRIHLDALGSFVWRSIDGARSVYELGGLVEERFAQEAHPVYERLAVFMKRLERCGFIERCRKTAALLVVAGLTPVLLSACSMSAIKKPFCVLFDSCEEPPKDTLNPAQTPAKTPDQVVWNQEPNGLRFRIEASPDLNRVGEGPLGLTVCVYQLKDTSAFASLAATATGIDTLLDCKLEPAGAKSSRNFEMQPGTSRFISTDRAEEARHLAVVAGYAHLRPEQCAATVPFPVHQDRAGVILKDQVYSAVPVQMLIRLGPEAVSISGVQSVR